MVSDIDRIDADLEENGCWIWPSSKLHLQFLWDRKNGAKPLPGCKAPWNSSRCVKRPQHPSRVARRSEASDRLDSKMVRERKHSSTVSGVVVTRTTLKHCLSELLRCSNPQLLSISIRVEIQGSRSSKRFVCSIPWWSMRGYAEDWKLPGK